MSEGKDWSIRAVEANGLGPDLIDEEHKLPWKKITDLNELENSLVTLIYSSGTTGLPKGVKLSHRNLVAEAVIPGDMFKAWLGSDSGPKNFEYRTLAHLPTAHIAGIQGYLISTYAILSQEQGHLLINP